MLDLPAPRIEGRLAGLPLCSNFLAAHALTGEFPSLEDAYPSLSMRFSLGPEPEWVHGSLEEVLPRHPGPYSCVFLGNHLEDPALREQRLRMLLPSLRPGARVLWWGNQRVCPIPPSLSSQLEVSPEPWVLRDRAMIRAEVHLAIRR
jgi:hypothetical protein